MRTFTLFHKMSDDGVIKQMRTRLKTSTDIMTSAARTGTGGAEYKFSMRIHHSADGYLRQRTAMLGVAARARFALAYPLLVKFGYRGS